MRIKDGTNNASNVDMSEGLCRYSRQVHLSPEGLAGGGGSCVPGGTTEERPALSKRRC